LPRVQLALQIWLTALRQSVAVQPRLFLNGIPLFSLHFRLLHKNELFHRPLQWRLRL
jgi:hypothetical protein